MNQNQYSATEQPNPTLNSSPAVWQVVIDDINQNFFYSRDINPLVIQDMTDRDNWGRSKYGVPLQPFNGRDPLVDLYQEFLDAIVYTKQFLLENPYDVIMGEIYLQLRTSVFQIRTLLFKRDGK